MNYSSLKYTRGFLLADHEVNSENLVNWKSLKNNHYYFYFNERVNWNYYENGEYWGCLVGSCLDPFNSTDQLNEILEKAVNLYMNSNDSLYDYTETLVGRYLFILGKNKDVLIFSDATGMKSIFYHSEKRIIATHAKLINDITSDGLSENVNLGWLSQYSNYHLPGHFTPYKNVYYLIPNHSLTWPNIEVKRYFPRSPIIYDHLDQKTDEIIEHTYQQLKLLSKKHKFIFSLSAGMDSRTSLSFMKDYLDQTTFFTYYFTDSSDPNYKGSDVLNLDHKVVNSMSSDLRLNHLSLPVDRAISKKEGFEEFKNILKQNTFLNHSANLAKFYIDYFGIDDYLHIRSTLYEIGRPVNRTKLKSKSEILDVNDAIKIYSAKAIQDNDVKKLMTSYMDMHNPNNNFNFDPFDLFYWESRMGTWHSQLLIQSDVSHDTHIFMNSHLLLRNMLSFPLAMRKNRELFMNIIDRNWPILRFWGINEDKTLLADINPHLSKSSLNLSDLEFSSGNSKKDVDIPVSYQKYETSAVFYIDKNAPNKNDFAEAIINLKLNPNQLNEIIIHLKSPFENPKNKGRMKYQVFYDEEPIIEEDISMWRETNQIIIPIKKGTSNLKLKVRIIAIKNCEPWNWGKAGTLIIEKISLRKGHTVENVTASSPYSKITIRK